MAKNQYGFIAKRYIQPNYYREIFCNFNAVYVLPDGSKVMIEARPHFLCSEKLGAEIDHYNVLKQGPCCRVTLHSRLKSQKAAVKVIEKLIENTPPTQKKQDDDKRSDESSKQ